MFDYILKHDKLVIVIIKADQYYTAQHGDRLSYTNSKLKYFQIFLIVNN